jgi:hypothetical protein
MSKENTGTLGATLDDVSMGQAITASGNVAASAATVGTHGESRTALFRTARRSEGMTTPRRNWRKVLPRFPRLCRP